MTFENGTTEEGTSFIEEGAASMQFLRPTLRPVHATERFDAIVIGGGQAGLSVGYHLARAGLRFVILDANERIGDAWRNRWDSLRLFTPAKYNGLDGMRFPAPRNYFPTKDEMADYLESYARRMNLPVRSAARAEYLFKRNDRYVVRVGSREYEAPEVVVAMAKYQEPKIPEFARSLASDIVQLHSIDYRSANQLQRGPVMLVGAGNSAADIALEVTRAGHRTTIAGRFPGQVPFRPEGFFGRHVFAPLVLGFMFRHVLTVNTPMGRKARKGALSHGAPLIRVKPRDLLDARVEQVPRVIGVRGGLPLLADGHVLKVANVIWCTGFRPAFDWIDLPIFDDDGLPRHRSGVVEESPGLYFVGLPFLHSMSSSMVHGVGRDAERLVGSIRARATQSVR